MDFDIFLGRFHPLVVHFPIALLMVSSVIEFVSRISRFRHLSTALPLLLLFGTISAFLSVLLGWLVAEDRGYDDSVLLWHRWLGISVFVSATFLWLVTINLIGVNSKIRTFLFASIFILISVTGHLGGVLARGEDFLVEHAPQFIRDLLVTDELGVLYNLPNNPDSVVVFKDMIAPILLNKCTPCHNGTQIKGGLVLSTQEGVKEGGENGPIIKEGKSFGSELFRRISLPPNHPKFMPLKTSPLSFGEVSLIRWWIDGGASYEVRLPDMPIFEDIENFLLRDFDYDPNPKPYFEIFEVEAANISQIQSLRKKGFIVMPLARNSNYLSVRTSQEISILSAELLAELLPIKANITWLDLGNKQVSDEHMKLVGQFIGLTKLHLNNNPISDEGIKHLMALKYLESLNLFDTKISDEGLQFISKLNSLKKLFLWQTSTTLNGISQLKRSMPKLEIDTGFSFERE